jgi:hypothetical protein
VSDQSPLHSAIRLGTNLAIPSSTYKLVVAFVLQGIVFSISSIILLVFGGYMAGGPPFNGIMNLSYDLPIIFIRITTILALTLGIVSVISYIKPSFKQSFLPFSLNQEASIASDSISEFITLRAGFAPKQQREADKLVTMAAIDERVARLRGRTNIMLGVIALALSSAVLVVLFAAQLTSIDVAATSNTDKLKTELTDANRILTELYRYRDLYKKFR